MADALIMTQADQERLERAKNPEDFWIDPWGNPFGKKPEQGGNDGKLDTSDKRKEAVFGEFKDKGLPTYTEEGEAEYSDKASLVEKYIGSAGLVLLGVIFIVLALVMSDFGQKLINTVKPL